MERDDILSSFIGYNNQISPVKVDLGFNAWTGGYTEYSLDYLIGHTMNK
jgi:hypothetical protein